MTLARGRKAHDRADALRGPVQRGADHPVIEDLLTAAYLGALWQNDRRIKTYIGGGHENLAAVVEYARRSGRDHVFSVRDRDFGPTNRASWGNAQIYNFSLATFEVECFLIDYASLANCVVNTAGHGEKQIEEWFVTRARGLLWWMACRKVIAGLREARQEKFPAHPRRAEVTTQAQAEAIVCGNEWVTSTAKKLKERVEPQRLVRDLADAHAEYERALDAGTWTSVFSGKELVEEALGWIYTRGARPRSRTWPRRWRASS